jgi:hypothetical protein
MTELAGYQLSRELRSHLVPDELPKYRHDAQDILVGPVRDGLEYVLFKREARAGPFLEAHYRQKCSKLGRVQPCGIGQLGLRRLQAPQILIDDEVNGKGADCSFDMSSAWPDGGTDLTGELDRHAANRIEQ